MSNNPVSPKDLSPKDLSPKMMPKQPDLKSRFRSPSFSRNSENESKTPNLQSKSLKQNTSNENLTTNNSFKDNLKNSLKRGSLKGSNSNRNLSRENSASQRDNSINKMSKNGTPRLGNDLSNTAPKLNSKGDIPKSVINNEITPK